MSNSIEAFRIDPTTEPPTQPGVKPSSERGHFGSVDMDKLFNNLTQPENAEEPESFLKEVTAENSSRVDISNIITKLIKKGEMTVNEVPNLLPKLIQLESGKEAAKIDAWKATTIPEEVYTAKILDEVAASKISSENEASIFEDKSVDNYLSVTTASIFQKLASREISLQTAMHHMHDITDAYMAVHPSDGPHIKTYQSLAESMMQQLTDERIFFNDEMTLKAYQDGVSATISAMENLLKRKLTQEELSTLHKDLTLNIDVPDNEYTKFVEFTLELHNNKEFNNALARISKRNIPGSPASKLVLYDILEEAEVLTEAINGNEKVKPLIASVLADHLEEIYSVGLGHEEQYSANLFLYKQSIIDGMDVVSSWSHSTTDTSLIRTAAHIKAHLDKISTQLDETQLGIYQKYLIDRVSAYMAKTETVKNNLSQVQLVGLINKHANFLTPLMSETVEDLFARSFAMTGQGVEGATNVELNTIGERRAKQFGRAIEVFNDLDDPKTLQLLDPDTSADFNKLLSEEPSNSDEQKRLRKMMAHYGDFTSIISANERSSSDPTQSFSADTDKGITYLGYLMARHHFNIPMDSTIAPGSQAYLDALVSIPQEDGKGAEIADYVQKFKEIMYSRIAQASKVQDALNEQNKKIGTQSELTKILERLEEQHVDRGDLTGLPADKIVIGGVQSTDSSARKVA